MCGIAGVWGQVDGFEKSLSEMLSRLHHRGPDGLGLKALSRGWLGHTRLAIVDLQNGNQPMTEATGQAWGVVNGEIYNHLDLRREIGEAKFHTHSDSEALIAGVAKAGPQAFGWLDGMFAGVVAAGDRLILGRDPLGIKPLYIGRMAQGGLLFASEIKALLPFAAEVQEVPPGTWIDSDGNRGHHSDLPAAGREREWLARPWVTNAEEAIRTAGSLLDRAVAKRLMADVPVGVFLSGGLDSSLIAALAVKNSGGQRLKSFAVGMPGSADLEHARQVATYLGTEHHERVVQPDELAHLLPRVIYHLESYDPSLVRSAVVTYLVSELAAQHVKVVLSGEGADELFAGYRYLADIREPLRLQAELVRTTADLHNTNLQRVDRMTMAHGLEGRVPFLDASLVRYALGIDPNLKMQQPGRTEKWLLRRVAEAYLPTTVVWRRKEKFAIGTGIAQVLEAYADQLVSDRTLARGIPAAGSNQPDTKEEWIYQRLFRRYFQHPSAAELVGHSRSLNPGQLTRWARGDIA